MKRTSSCRICRKLISSRGEVFGRDDSYSEHIAEAHPEVRSWLRQQRLESKERLEFANRTAFDLAPSEQ